MPTMDQCVLKLISEYQTCFDGQAKALVEEPRNRLWQSGKRTGCRFQFSKE